MHKCYKKCKKGKSDKNNFLKFEYNLSENLLKLEKELNSGNYKITKYNVFKVFEPKERVVMSLPFKDKIVQKLICDYILEPKLEPTFIYDNYASRKNKGTHFGLDRLEKFMHKFYRKKR